MKTFWKIFWKTILILLIAAIVIPVGYMAWRANQPMDLPQFKGLTYYQYQSWRKVALHQMAVNYHAAYPQAKMGGGLDMCYNVDLWGNLLISMPMAGHYTLAGMLPDLAKIVPADGRPFIPKDVTVLTLLPSWWLTYEKLVWYGDSNVIHDAVEYCRLQPSVPTPAQLQTLLAKQAVAKQTP